MPRIEPELMYKSKPRARIEKKTPGITRAESMPVKESNNENVETSPEHPRAKLSVREQKIARRERGWVIV